MFLVIGCLTSFAAWKLILKNKTSLLRLVILNVCLAVFAYAYYIGYSWNALKTIIFGVPINAFYYSVMAAGIAVVLAFLTKYWSMLTESTAHAIYRFDKDDRYKLLAVVLLAFAVRLIGINWGAGESFHGDEGNLVRPPIQMARDNTFMSSETLYPSQITSKFLSIVFKIMMLCGDAIGAEVSNLTYLCVARGYVVVLSTLIVVCVYFIANYLKKGAGIAAAVLVAFFPPFVQAAHCVTGDTFVALCFSLALLCSFYYYHDEKEFKWLAAMSFLAVLAMLDKYHGMVIFGLIAITVCIKQVQNRQYLRIFIQGIVTLLISCVLVAAIVPNLVTNLADVWASLTHLTDDYEEGATFAGGLLKYTVWFFSHTGLLVMIPIVMGIRYFIKSRKAESIVLSIGVIEILIICCQNRNYIRWAYPFYLVLLILVAVGFSALRDWTQEKRAYIGVILGVGGCLVVGNMVLESVLLDALYANSQKDTRIVSEKWCLENGITQENSLYDHYTCWSPGGMVSRYDWKYYMSVDTSVECEQEELSVRHIGKKYAIVLNNSELLEENGYQPFQVFQSDYHFSDASYSNYSDLSPKVLEIVSIAYDADLLWHVLFDEEFLFGSDIAVYDISTLPSYEKFYAYEFNTANEYINRKVDTLPAGDYEISVEGNETFQGVLRLSNSDGTILAECMIENGIGAFTIAETAYEVGVVLETDDEFVSCKYELK